MNEHRPGLGGSDAAAAIGLCRWKPPIQLWRELRGEVPRFEGSEVTHWGNMLEPAIRQEYANRHGVEIIVPDTWRMAADGWRRATPDGLVPVLVPLEEVGDRAVVRRFREQGLAFVIDRGLEVKAVGLRMADEWGEAGTDDIPVHYEIQGRWYMPIFGLDRWDFAVLIGGQEYREYTIHRDRDLEAEIIAEASRFWHEHHLAGVPPRPDASSEYARYLAETYAAVTGEYLRADVELDAKLRDLRELTDTIAELEAEKAQLNNEIRAEIGEAAGVDCSMGRIKNIRVAGRRSIDWESVAAEAVLAAQLAGAEVDRQTLIDRFTDRGKPHNRFSWPKAAKRKAA